MLCPHCLHSVPRFVQTETPNGTVLVCPHCHDGSKPIPNLYPKDYAKYQTAPVCLMGLSGHGKTRYVDALIADLGRVGKYWPGCSPVWLDENQIREIRDNLRKFRSGAGEWHMSQLALPDPQVLRLDNVPRFGGSQLILFDHGGETFEESRAVTEYGTRFARSPHVVWLASLRERPRDGDDVPPGEDMADVPAEKFTDALTIYRTAMETMGADPKGQTVVLTLTKAERLLDRWPDFPASARRLLDRDLLGPAAGDPWLALQQASDELRGWLIESGYHDIVHQLERFFRGVRYCAVSAQGAEASGEGGVPFSPKAVLGPLFWVWRPGPGAWLCGTDGANRTFYPSLAQAVEDAPAGGTVELEPGEHDLQGPLKVLRPLTITGPGADKAEVWVAAGGFALGVQVDGAVTVRGLTIGYPNDGPGDVVRVLTGEVSLEGLAFRGGKPGADRGKGTPRGCGLALDSGARGRVADCRFVRNPVGLRVRGAGPLQVSGCSFDGTAVGVQAADRGAVRAERNVFARNEVGLMVSEDARVWLSKDRFDRCTEAAVRAAGTAVVDAAGVECDGGGKGAGGLEFREESRGTVTGGKVTGVTGCGVLADDRAEVTVRGAEVCNNPGVGATYQGQSTGAFEGNTVEDNEEGGVWLDGTPCPQLLANRLGHNGPADVVVSPTVPRDVSIKALATPGVRIKDQRTKGNGLWLFGKK